MGDSQGSYANVALLDELYRGGQFGWRPTPGSVPFSSVPGGHPPATAPMPGQELNIPAAARGFRSSNITVVHDYRTRPWLKYLYDRYIAVGEPIFVIKGRPSTSNGMRNEVTAISMAMLNHLFKVVYEQLSAAGITEGRKPTFDELKALATATRKEGLMAAFGDTGAKALNDPELHKLIKSPYRSAKSLFKKLNFIGFFNNETSTSADSTRTFQSYILNNALNGPCEVRNFWGTVQRGQYLWIVLRRHWDEARQEYTYFEMVPLFKRKSGMPSPVHRRYIAADGSEELGPVWQVGIVIDPLDNKFEPTKARNALDANVPALDSFRAVKSMASAVNLCVGPQVIYRQYA